jgi:hypothetical protein
VKLTEFQIQFHHTQSDPVYRSSRHLSGQIFILSMIVQECDQFGIIKDEIESENEAEFKKFQSKECFEALFCFRCDFVSLLKFFDSF